MSRGTPSRSARTGRASLNAGRTPRSDRGDSAVGCRQTELGFGPTNGSSLARSSHVERPDGQNGSALPYAFGLEDPDYLCRQLITYIGNKRALLGPIGEAVEAVKRRLNKTKLRVFDAFSGSGVVSRFLKAHASHLASNDIEDYATVISRCYLRNRSTVDLAVLTQTVADLNARVEHEPLPRGFIEDLYSPQDEQAITRNDRVFYTTANARRLDNYRRMIGEVADDGVSGMLLASLLHKASVHANNAGVFKGFYKNRHTGIGQYGGTSSDALTRIRGLIELELPILSRFECDCAIHQGDANQVARIVRDIDLAYVDPPYNQHPYGSNYFMLNLLVNYERPAEISRMSGIPVDWRRSGYNVRAKSLALLRQLFDSLDARFLLVSFNDEGFVTPDDMLATLRRLGAVSTFETRYNTYRGSRNLRNRKIHVVEHLFLVERR